MRDNGTPWQGLLPDDQRTDTAFCQFVDWLYGVRAMIRNLKTYIRTVSDTPAKMITRWCPASDCVPGDPAGTARYIARVESLSGIDRDYVMSTSDRNALFLIANSMAQVEQWDTVHYPALTQYFNRASDLITRAEFDYAIDVLGA